MVAADWKFVEGSCPTTDTDNPTTSDKFTKETLLGWPPIVRGVLALNLPPLPDAPPLKDDEPILGRQYTVSREEAEASMKEDESSHTFIKVSHQDYATCEDCGSKVQFYNNPTAHAEMMTHKCEDTQPGNGIDK